MLPWESRSNSGLVRSTRRGISTSLSLAVLLGISGALGVSSSRAIATQPFQVAQNQSDTGDVMVETKPQQPDASTSTDSTDNRSPSTTATTPRFTCEMTNGQYTVMYHPESQPGQAYNWATPSAMGGGWTPEMRCREISRRLEAYRPDGLLEMRTGTENGYPIVCVTTQQTPTCRIVLTVPEGQDPTITRDRVFQNLTVADNGQQTQAVNTLVDDGQGNLITQIGQALNIKLPINLPALGGRQATSEAINLRPFLDRADGGTALNLRGGTPTRPAPRLNPNRFR